MSKRYYRRYRRTYPKQKWQSNCVEIIYPITEQAGPVGGAWFASHKLVAKNVVPITDAGEAQISANAVVKTGNFKAKGYYNYGTTNSGVYSILYLIYVPQGINPDNPAGVAGNLGTSIFYSHPEWVLCWTRLDGEGDDGCRFSFSSRLKRNLNSGDSIFFGLMVIGTSNSTFTRNILCRATVQYNARSN